MIQAGFEFEFGHDIRPDLIKQVLKYHYPNNKIYTLTDQSEIFDMTSKCNFIFKTDTSVDIQECKYKNTEIATPVFIGKKEILSNFTKIFNLLKILDVKTNKTCSLHINVSFTEDTEVHKINFGKLYTYINEHQLLKVFKRSNNFYCKPCIPYKKCISIIQESKTDNDLLKRIERYMLVLVDEHHRAIALDKIKNNELYITEFRFIGGNYIDKFDLSSGILNSIIDGMNFSIGKNTQTKISRIIRNFKLYYKQLDF